MHLGVHVAADWRGLPAVAESDADYVSGRLAKRAEHAERQRLHNAEVRRWTENREKAVRDACKAAADPIRRAGKGDPKAATAGSRAAREAGRRYELTHPRPDTYGPRHSVRLAFVDENEVK